MAIFHYFKAFTYIKAVSINHYIPTVNEHVFTQFSNCALLEDETILVTISRRVRTVTILDTATTLQAE